MYDTVMVGIGHRMFVKTNGMKKKKKKTMGCMPRVNPNVNSRLIVVVQSPSRV